MRGLILLLAFMSACAHHKGPIVPAEKFAVVVINHHWLDVDVYLLRSGQRIRLGTVSATTTQEFLVEDRLLGSSRQIALLGEAIGSHEAVRTEALSLQPGQYVEWTLENTLRRSSVAVY